MSGEAGSVLLSSEAEAYVEALVEFDIKDVGNQRWYQQHEYVEKLNMQAIVSASAFEEEFIKEYLISYEKIPTLIKDLIVTELWKEKVFPKFAELNLEFKITFPVYIVLYHEATVITLLETVMYHKESCESAADFILDLADYCVRKLAPLLDREEDEEDDEPEVQTDVSSMEELQQQHEKLRFDIAMKTISIIRYIADNLNSLPLSVCTRLLNTHDLPVMLVNLYRNPPWSRRRKDKIQKYTDSKWQNIEDSNRFHLSKLEGQVLITLFQLLMSEDCQKKYELDTYRKNEILKLRPVLTEVVLDQLPVLSGMQRYLEQLSIMDPPMPKRDLILEQVPEVRDNLVSTYEGKWRKLAKYQYDHHFNSAKLDMLEQAKRIADTYNMETLENFITEPPKCAVCGSPASKRCSRCQNEWYCRRECQVGHWKKHKAACDLLKQVVDSEKMEKS